MPSQRASRREFLGTAATLIAAPYVIPAAALAAPGRVGANDRIHVGLIGAGGRSTDLVRESPADLQIVAVADCDLRQAARYPKFTPYQDYRRMFAQEKLDAVIVATPTHVRVRICIHAMQAGLDVYAEKPLTLTIEEGQFLIRAERKYQRIVQVGTQQRSIAINNFGSDLVRNGAIGKVQTVICPNFLGPERRGTLPTKPVPVEMNWDMWCSQTELIPFSPSLHPGLGKWGRFRDYDGGGLGWGVTGWGAHAFDQVQRALGTDDTDPVEIWPETPGPDGKVSMRYASGTILKLDLPRGKGPGLGAIFVGDKGKIEINRNKLASNPPELIQDAAATGRQIRVRQRGPRASPQLGTVHANPRQTGGFRRGRASFAGDLPPHQYLPRAGPQAALGPGPRGVRRRRRSQPAPVAATPQGLRAA